MKLLPILLAGVMSSASAADWVQVAYANGDSMWIDQQSIVAVGKFRKAWSRNEVATAGTLNGKQYNKMKALNYFVCAERQVTMTQATFHDLQGSVVYSYDSPLEQAKLLEIAPDTFNEAALKFVCNAKVKP